DGGLNLRTGPGLEFTVVTVMPGGSSVELRGEPQNGFYPVSLDGTTGGASADFLSLGDEATEPATEEPAAPADEAETPTEEATEPVEEATEPVAEETETPTDVATEVPTEEPTEVATEAPAHEPAVDGSDGYTEDELI